MLLRGADDAFEFFAIAEGGLASRGVHDELPSQVPQHAFGPLGQRRAQLVDVVKLPSVGQFAR